MTREEAIERLKGFDLIGSNEDIEFQYALDMAIEALEEEPCGKDINVTATDCITEDREEGHWVEDIINGKALISCSECLHVISNYEGCFHYCPYCGKELKGVIRNDKNKI